MMCSNSSLVNSVQVLTLGYEIKTIAQNYATNKNYDFSDTRTRSKVLKLIINSNFKKYILFSQSSNLNLDFLQKLYCTKKCIVLMTGQDLTTIQNLAIKNLKFKEKYSSNYCMTENYTANIKNTYFEDFRKTLELEKLHNNGFTYFLGGGNVYEVRLGNNFVLGAKKTFTKTKMLSSPRKELNLEAIRSNILIINGCVAGVVSPTTYEYKPNKTPLCLKILKSNFVNTYVAPFEVKAALPDEGILASRLYDYDISSAQIVQILNNYLEYHNVMGRYACYGDDSKLYKNLEKILYKPSVNQNTITFHNDCYIGILNNFDDINNCLVSDNDINYFSFIDSDQNKKCIIFSRKNLNNKKIIVKSKIAQEKIYAIKNFYSNLASNEEVSKLLPLIVRKQMKKYIDLQNTIEKVYPYYSTNTRVNLNMIKVVRDIYLLQDEIKEEIKNYWQDNTVNDRIRIYDLHYGRYKNIICNDFKTKCPVCKECWVTKTINKNMFGSFARILVLCPSCSIISDIQDPSLRIKVTSSRRNNKIDGQIIIIDENDDVHDIDIFVSLRGIESKVKTKIILKSIHKKVILYEFPLNYEFPENEMYYLSIFTIKNGQLNYYKKTV